MNEFLRVVPPFLFFGLLALHTAIAFSIPLIPYGTDSAWYYMNVVFVETGQYIHESIYRFSEPSQLYPFFGYSLLLYASKKLAAITGLTFAFLVKLLQIIMYDLTAILTVKIVFDLTRRTAVSYACGLFFLLYYSYFTFVYVVMSEIYAVFLLVLFGYLFVRSTRTLSPTSVAPLCVVGGCLTLVKPALLPAVLCLVALLVVKSCRAGAWRPLLALPLLILFPVMQAFFSKAYYDNYAIKTGAGWNLWNRVIWHDRLVPIRSEELSRLRRIYHEHGREMSLGFWWDVARDLSEFGYTERETQEICWRVAIDGIREFPLGYLSGVLSSSYRSFNDPVDAENVHDTQERYRSRIRNFIGDRQHLPLANALAPQPVNRLGQAYLLEFHDRQARRFNRFAGILHNPVSFVLFSVCGLYCMFEAVRRRFESCVEPLGFWVIASSLVVASNMAEPGKDRYTLPAVIFAFMSFVLAMNHFIEGRLGAGRRGHPPKLEGTPREPSPAR